MATRTHTRRDFIRLTGLTVAGVVIAACAGEPEVVEKVTEEPQVTEAVETEAPTVEEVEEPTPTVEEAEEPTPTVEEAEASPAAPSKYKESPMLAEKVARGELPPVDERLPEEPRVSEIIEEIGQYGGTLTVGDLSMNLQGPDTQVVIDRAQFLRISHDLTHAVPHLLKDWDISDDFTQITCYMRKGLKWSDGAPVTTEDVIFWYEDVLLNTELTPMPDMRFRPGDEIMKLDVMDDYTFKLIFARPNPSFILVNMAHNYGFGNGAFLPSHFLKQFHIKYNDKANDLAKEAGLDFWYQLLGREANLAEGLNRPRLNTFIPLRDTPQMVFYERNAYYHAVDPEGNQLPYIDKLVMDRAADLSMFDAKVVAGTYDFSAFSLTIQNYTTYSQGAEQADSRIIIWPTGRGSDQVYNVNMNWPDNEWREVFSDDRFRQALSLAINRQEINDVVYYGNSTNRQFTVIPTSRHYRPEYAAAYADYDPERANALLDEMGLEWNAAHTHRLWPVSKQPMIISWDLVELAAPVFAINEIVTEHWREIGIEIQVKSILRTLLTQKILANEEPMSCWRGDETADTLFLRRPKFFAPLDGDESCWAVLWGRWYNTRGEQGEEPPQMIKDLYNWMDEYNLTDSNEPARQVLESQAEHIWTIGTVGDSPHPLIVRNTLRNVSETGFWTWDSLWTHPEFPEQWFFKF